MTFPDGLRTKAARDKVALDLCNEIRAGVSARRGLKQRWDKNEKIYRNEPGASGNQIIDGVEPYHIPLVKQKLDWINGVVHHAITGIEPYVQVSAVDGSDDVAALIQNDLHFLIKKANFAKYLWEALQIASTCGKGMLRLRYIDGRGFEFKVTHPADLSVYPASAETIANAKTVGVRFSKMYSEVQEMQKSGEYDKACDVIYGYNPDEDPSGRNPSFDKVDSTEILTPADQLVQLFEGCTQRDIKGGKRWYKFCVALDSNQLLSMDEFGASSTDEMGFTSNVPYSKPWIFALAYEAEYGKFWPSTSLGQHLQGLQQAFSDGFNIMWGGSWSAAFPVPIISGGSFGEKLKKYRPGDILENPSAIQAQVIGVQFNPAAIPSAIQMLENTADAVLGVSKMSTGQQLKSGATATESSFLAESQKRSEDRYTTYITLMLQEMFEFAFELYKIHHDDILRTFGMNVALPDISLLGDSKFVIDVNGKATTNAPQALIQKLQMILQIAMTMPQLGVDVSAVVRKVIGSLELPFNVNEIMPRQQGMAGVQGQSMPGMGSEVPDGLLEAIAGLLGQSATGGPSPGAGQNPAIEGIDIAGLSG